jgi:hypothetical protein
LAPEQGCDKVVVASASKSVGSDGALGVLVWCSVALARYNLVVSSPWIAARTARRGRGLVSNGPRSSSWSFSFDGRLLVVIESPP